MIVWRIAQKKYLNDLSGEGARINGGRWNPKGKAMLYTSSHLSLAVLELLAYVPLRMLNASFHYLKIKIPDNNLTYLDIPDLPDDWRDYPSPESNTFIGKKWLESNEKLSLVLPSAILVHEQNVLINPGHVDAGKIKVIESGVLGISERVRV